MGKGIVDYRLRIVFAEEDTERLHFHFPFGRFGKWEKAQLTTVFVEEDTERPSR